MKMKPMKELAKKCMAIATALTLVGAITAFPLSVLADDFTTDGGTIPHDGTNYINKAQNVINNGTVLVNMANASIASNNETVSGNKGIIENNYGRVQTNFNTDPNNLNLATVVNNFGTIQRNYDEVTNNYGGTVTNATGSGFVTNQFYSVTITGLGDGTIPNYEVADADGENGFVEKSVDAAGTRKQFLKVANNGDNDNRFGVAIQDLSGVITIRANNDYEITGDNQDVDSDTIAYTLERQNDGSYVLTITALGANVELTRTALGLTITGLNLPPDVVIRVDNSVTISEDETRSNSATTGTNPATGNAITAAQINAMIESALAVNPNATVLNLDLGNDPSFTADTLIALCEKNNVAKRCHFTHNGMKFVLFIPVVDPTSAAYQQCKALLDAEEGKQAGPIRLSYLFAPVKFSLSQE